MEVVDEEVKGGVMVGMNDLENCFFVFFIDVSWEG